MVEAVRSWLMDLEPRVASRRASGSVARPLTSTRMFVQTMPQNETGDRRGKENMPKEGASVGVSRAVSERSNHGTLSAGTTRRCGVSA